MGWCTPHPIHSAPALAATRGTAKSTPHLRCFMACSATSTCMFCPRGLRTGGSYHHDDTLSPSGAPRTLSVAQHGQNAVEAVVFGVCIHRAATTETRRISSAAARVALLDPTRPPALPHRSQECTRTSPRTSACVHVWRVHRFHQVRHGDLGGQNRASNETGGNRCLSFVMDGIRQLLGASSSTTT